MQIFYCFLAVARRTMSFVFLLQLLLLMSLTAGEIRLFEMSMQDDFCHLLDRFVFTEKGRLEVNITGLSFSGPPPLPDQVNNISKVGFFLSRYDTLSFLREKVINRTVCPLGLDEFEKVFTFDQLLPNLNTSEWNLVYSESKPGPATLAFVNCPQQMKVSMTVRSAMYNLEEGQQQQRNYLACTSLPMVYYLFSLVYLVLFALWIRVLYANMAYASRIHYLMLVVVFLTALNMFCEGGDKASVMRTGSGDAWELWFYTSSLLKGLSLYTLMLLIGSGWEFLKPHLLKKEKRVLIAVVGLQCAGNAALVLAHKRAGYYGFHVYWSTAWTLANLASTIAALYTSKWSIQLLVASHTHRRDSFVLKNLKFFRNYVDATVLFIFLSHTAAFYANLWLSLDNLSIVLAGVEGLTVVFYVYTARKFTPQPQEHCLVDEEVEAAAREELALCLSRKDIDTIYIIA